MKTVLNKSLSRGIAVFIFFNLFTSCSITDKTQLSIREPKEKDIVDSISPNVTGNKLLVPNPKIKTDSLYREKLPLIQAIFSPNIYRSRTDMDAFLVGRVNSSLIYNDSVVIKINEKTKKFDYKIINTDAEGYTIIKVLPKKKFIKVTKQKSEVLEIYLDTIINGVNTIIKKEIIRKKPYQIYNVVFLDSTDIANYSESADNYYFAVKKDQFKLQSKILLTTRLTGVPLVHPFKFRPKIESQKASLSGSFTLSYNFGFKYKLNVLDAYRQNYITIIPYGFGLGAEKYFKINEDGTESSKSDVLALTYYQGGILFNIDKVNLGCFVGFDSMIGSNNDWFYQGRLWLSLGLGYKLGGN